MAISTASQPVRVAFIGVGAVTAYHHLPGLRLDPRARLVAICDADPGLLEKRKAEWDVEHATTDADGPLPSRTRSTPWSSPRPTTRTGRSPWPRPGPASTSCARSRWA